MYIHTYVDVELKGHYEDTAMAFFYEMVVSNGTNLERSPVAFFFLLKNYEVITHYQLIGDLTRDACYSLHNSQLKN